MGMAMRKGAQNYVGMIFGAAHKLVPRTSQHGWKISHPAQILEASISNVRECCEIHISPGLIPLVIELSRAFCCLGKALAMPKLGYIMTFGVLLPSLKREMAAKPWYIHITLDSGCKNTYYCYLSLNVCRIYYM